MEKESEDLVPAEYDLSINLNALVKNLVDIDFDDYINLFREILSDDNVDFSIKKEVRFVVLLLHKLIYDIYLVIDTVYNTKNLIERR